MAPLAVAALAAIIALTLPLANANGAHGERLFAHHVSTRTQGHKHPLATLRLVQASKSACTETPKYARTLITAACEVEMASSSYMFACYGFNMAC